MTTLRIQYTKEKFMCFLGHLEMMKLFERVFRFNKLPLKYSEGFNPIPKMTFASPLSVGYSSKCEIMEVQLESECPLEKVMAMKFPDGITITKAKYVTSKKSLMASLSHSDYLLKVEFKQRIDHLPLDEWFEKFLSAGEINFEKKAKNGKFRSLNLLEYVHALKLVYKGENDLILSTTLQSGSQGSLNPETFVNVMLKFFELPYDVISINVERTALHYKDETGLKPLFEMCE
jgi:radical SAM-linked protein